MYYYPRVKTSIP